jgi:hypothetical protein
MKKLIKRSLELFQDNTELKHQHFNRIKDIIQNKDNDVSHLTSIRLLIEGFDEKFGVSNLSNSLRQFQLDFIKTLNINKLNTNYGSSKKSDSYSKGNGFGGMGCFDKHLRGSRRV